MKTDPMNADISRRLPSPQGVALAIMQACQKDDSTSVDIARLVHADPALTGRLLQLANAAATGARPVLSAHEAVNRMGLQTLQQLALGFSLIDQFQSGECAGFDYGGFWSNSLLMAVAMQEMGGPLRMGSADELFSLGLLARVGCLALATVYPDQYTVLLGKASSDAQLLSLEKADLATDHLEMTSRLHALWRIPAVLAQAAVHHEDPDNAPLQPGSRCANIAGLLHLAWRLASFIGKPPADPVNHLASLNQLTGQIGMAAGEFEPLVDAIRQRWTALASQFKIRATVAQARATVVPPDVPSLPSAQTVPPDNSKPIRVLLVDDDRVMQQLVQAWLKDEPGLTLVTAGNGLEALEAATEFKPHVVITDWMMPVMDGPTFCRTLRASNWGQNIYILMLTANTDDAHISQAFEAGVDAYLEKPQRKPSLQARFKAARRFVQLRLAWEDNSAQLGRARDALSIANRSLVQSALTDPLTHLANRRAGQTALIQAWAGSVRRGQAMSVISIDIDHFKKVNDQHGHAAGDMVLQKISQSLQSVARIDDLVCRWGGEEFLLICPSMTLREAWLVAERLRKKIAETPVLLVEKNLRVTVSIGLASWRPELTHHDQLLAEADKALYQAKAAGRNRVAQVAEYRPSLVRH